VRGPFRLAPNHRQNVGISQPKLQRRPAPYSAFLTGGFIKSLIRLIS
jgi:hypothetical protein